MKRHKAEWLRAYGSKERVLFVQSLGCIVAPRLGRYAVCGISEKQVAHIEAGGVSRKADADKTVCLCACHHEMLHRIGRATFERTFRLNLDRAAAETEAKWQEVSA